MARQENEMGINYGPSKMDLMFALFDDQFRTVMFKLDAAPPLHLWVRISGVEKTPSPWEWRVTGWIHHFGGGASESQEKNVGKLNFSALYRTTTRKGIFTFEY